ncbi:DEAD/DEAH box helicase [Sphingobacterium sp. N143]|uniref:SNF2-related protein n=1 Tax=Sphingobacterium sp. N143 TaxID=2746727 RepID=UPI002574AFA0|nr:SNF2-related protein [Sphingobacterium sp. N143]MDM1296450.1 DEAD/DEAH box helicase [Sphingobacterium sp. N143]
MGVINNYQAKYFAYELSKKATAESPEKFGTTLMDAKVELNPHQIEAALFAFKSPYSKGAILADEVGLGKTIEAGILLSQKWAEGKRKILIICPSSLRKQWVNELADKFYLKAEVLDNISYNKKVRDGVKNPFDAEATIKICSYQFARKKAEEIQLTSWDLVVIDEAHYLRNAYKYGNVTAQTIQNAIRDYKKVLLTATPLQNRLDELFGLVSFIDQEIFGDIKSFRRNYVLESGARDIEGLKERLNSIVHRTLRRDVKEFINYRERIPITQQFTPTAQEQDLYEKVLDYLRQEITYAFPPAQKHLMQSVIFKLLGSSSFAISRTLEALIKRLKDLLENAKVVDDDLYKMFLEEYENLDDELDEFEGDTQEDDEQIEISLDDKIAIEEELKQLEEFLILANSIQHNEKGEKLLQALDKGFDKLNELGAKQKALIFTESTRTQQYLFERLSKEKYNGRIVLFNGNNADPLSNQIYKDWLADDKNAGKITGSKAVDIRQALVDAFRSDKFDIMIATEAAAEGINLQFCSMIVNYDLPWNPQRVEQRIGRCHRYGQEYDVVVVNFLNAANAVEARVFELLENKFQLFAGVFGSSDEVLGSIENGVDFEKRIIEVYKQCRTKEEIETYFAKLQKEFEDQIDEKVKQTQSKLFDHFEASVIDKLRITLSETRVFIEKYEKWLWELLRFYMKHKAQFIYDDFTFVLNTGEKYTLNKKREDAKPFRLQSAIAQQIIQQGKKEQTPPAHLKFNFSQHKATYSDIEKLKSKQGILKITNLEVSSEIESHSVLLFTGNTTSGEILNDEMCRFILGLPCIEEEKGNFKTEDVEQVHQKNKQQKLDHLEDTDALLMQREFKKFHNWADDKIAFTELELREAKKAEKEIDRQAMQEGLSTAEALVFQETLAKAKKKVSRLKREMFDREEEIEKERDQMIIEAKQKLNRTITEEELFTISFELI